MLEPSGGITVLNATTHALLLEVRLHPGLVIGRNRRGWQHHQTLSLIACWFLTCATKHAEKKIPAITINQMKIAIATILRNELHHDTSQRIKWRIEQRPKRNQLARLYHWKQRKLTVSKT